MEQQALGSLRFTADKPLETDTVSHRHRQPEPESRRTFNAPRRNSRTVAHGRKEKYGKLSKKEQWLRLFALKAYRKKLRKPGQRFGAAGTISAGAVEFYERLLQLESRFGLVDPSVAWLAEQENVPEKVIHGWKDQLNLHGFLFWERRCGETGNDGRRGPQLHQTSKNRYWSALPARAADLVKTVRRKLGLVQNPRHMTEVEKAQMRPLRGVGAIRRRNASVTTAEPWSAPWAASRPPSTKRVKHQGVLAGKEREPHQTRPSGRFKNIKASS